MRSIKLKITKTNIKNGIPVNPGHCPIANSIMETVKNAYYVRVLPSEAAIKVRNGKSVTTYRSKLPEKANNFIRKFDDSQKVKPFAFTLNLNKVNKSLAELI